MTELDFDELDKAVSSLMTNVKPSKDQTPPDQPAQPEQSETPEAPSTDSERNEPVSERPSHDESHDQDASENENADGESVVDGQPEVGSGNEDNSDPQHESSDLALPDATLAQPSVAIKRRGQFMDMKHPSADMNTPQSVRPPASRQGVSLSPVTLPTQDLVVEEQPVAAPDSSLVPDAAADGLVLPDEPVGANSEQQETPTSNVSEDEATSSDLLSPFLPDAKVEKRPLGATAPTGDAAAVSGGASLPDLPKELHESLMAFESDTTEGTAPNDKQPSVEAQESEPVTDSGDQASDSMTANSESAEDEHESNPVESPTAPVPLADSIPPQYNTRDTKAPENHEGQSAHSLYDTSTNAAALDPHEAKSHWTVLLIIVAIVVVGSAVGAALYMYQTGAF